MAIVLFFLTLAVPHIGVPFGAAFASAFFIRKYKTSIKNALIVWAFLIVLLAAWPYLAGYPAKTNNRVREGTYQQAYYTSAYPNEPDGFRGMRLGTDLSTLEDMVFLGEDTVKGRVWQAYNRKNEDLYIHGIEIKSITYYCTGHQLRRVAIAGVGEEKFRSLSIFLHERHGDPHRVYTTNEHDIPTIEQIWTGNTTTIWLSCDLDSQRFLLRLDRYM